MRLQQYFFNIIFLSVNLPAAHFAPARSNCLLNSRDRDGDGHVVDHGVHAVDIGGELGDKALFGLILGNAAQGDNALRG